MSVISDNVDAASRSALALFRVGAHAQAAPTAITAAAVTITYTTDDPAFTANGAQLIADGDAVTAIEALHSLLEVKAFNDALTVDIADARTALAALLASGAVQGDTANITANTLFSAGIAWTFTTDNPAFTAGGTTVVADGDAATSTTTRAEMLDLAQEMNAQNVKQLADLTQLVKRINALVGGGSEVFGYGAVPSLTSSATAPVISFTTDNPVITPDSAVTISDGDAPSAPNTLELGVELRTQLVANRADINNIRTSLVAALKLCGIV